MTEEAETYNSSVAGIDIEAIRAGAGVAPTEVLAASCDRVTLTRSKVGFPMLSRATIPDDTVIVAYISSAAPGSRWCEIDLEPGDVVAYGPAAEHTAKNLPGLDFSFVITDRKQLDEHADQLGTCIESPSRGEVHLLPRTPRTDLVSQVLPMFADAAVPGECPSAVYCDDVLRAMTLALSERDRVRRVGSSIRIDDRRVVHACIEYADSIGRIPSISELCLISHTSERRLRTAFTTEYGLPPSRYFKAWALEKAHRRLLNSDARANTVTEVALELGFWHLGRFSCRYREVFGESPSATLTT